MKKLEYFAEVVEREVEARKRRAKHQLANDLGKKAAAAVSEAEREVNARVEAARREMNRNANRKIAAVTTEAKAAFNAVRNSHQAKLLAEVAEELTAFTKSAEYESYLIEKIAASKGEFTIAKLTPQDMQHAEKIHQNTGITAVTGETDYIGGFILLTENKKIQSDHTFKHRLEVM